MSQRHIHLGMPGYGNQTEAAGRAFWRACADDTRLRRDSRFERDIVYHEYSQGSLLASNFNRMWVTALNRVQAGERIDYFAMLHDDLGPEDFWLDKAIDELEAKGLDMLGVVAPIKDTQGVTSIALARADGDNWRPLCRLTMHEVYTRLPATFTSEHVGAPLLLNTGCWVCKFDESWASQVHFTINDRIVIDKNTGQYESQTESEDWYFSRLCHELGLKIGCTRKVRLLHTGRQDFSNTFPWGALEHDISVPASVIPDQTTADIRFPFDVDGWLLPEEGEALAELAQGKRVLEIGSYCGKSTICLAQTAQFVLSIDPHDGRGTPSPKGTFDTLVSNLERYGLKNVVCWIDTSDVVLDHQTQSNFDFAFIDGAHDYESVKSDIEHALSVLKPDGLLAFHDYRKHPGQFDGRWDPGVNQAVDELVASGGELLSIHASLAIVRPPAAIVSPIPLEVSSPCLT